MYLVHFSFIFLASALGGVTQAKAQVTCRPEIENIPKTYVIPLAPINISAGVDMPVNTEIYHGSTRLGWDSANRITCWASSPPETMNFGEFYGIQDAPMPISNINAGIYETGIPGIGVKVGDGVTGATKERPLRTLRTFNLERPGEISSHSNLSSFINLVKTGPLIPGSYPLNAANLPTATRYFDNRAGYPTIQGFPILTSVIQYQGVINVSAQTCTTPDVDVPMGKHDANTTFTGIGSTTSWIKVNLTLQNCPTFYGYYDRFNSIWLFDGDRGGELPAGISDSRNNQIGARFTPNTSVVDAAKGIMAIDTTETTAASGIGIQLGWGEATPVPIDLNTESRMTLPKDGSPTISVPLSARYIQTANTVTPGRADGKLTFTINYY
ncbi:hypothetical protein BSQ98_10255 [Serratia liquefaciens]|nr:hypothetical protein BSQ98_10255 [Serratia liquefaciens]